MNGNDSWWLPLKRNKLTWGKEFCSSPFDSIKFVSYASRIFALPDLCGENNFEGIVSIQSGSSTVINVFHYCIYSNIGVVNIPAGTAPEQDECNVVYNIQITSLNFCFINIFDLMVNWNKKRPQARISRSPVKTDRKWWNLAVWETLMKG